MTSGGLLPYVFAATAAGVVGGLIAVFWVPGVRAPIGAIAVGWLLEGASRVTVATTLAFGAAPHLPDRGGLLVESIQAEESLLSMAMLLAGFLVVLR